MSNKYPGGFVSLGGQITSYSNYFNGSAYLSTTSSANLQPGSSDFCVEAWIYPTIIGSSRAIYSANDNSTGTNLEFRLYYSTSGVFAWYYSTSGYLSQLSSTIPLVLNQWSHVVWSRSGSTVSLFVNGSRVATGSISGGSSASTAYAYIGNFITSPTWQVTGYLSNVRFVKGSSVYIPSNFSITVPTAPFNPITNTQLLTCQSSTIVDNSTNAFTLTNTGSITSSSAQPDFQAYNPNNLDPALGASTPGIWTLPQALNAEVTRSWPMYDPYYKNVVLNLHGNAAVGGSFASDASANNFYVTVNGDARPSTRTPFSTLPNSGSGYFDGTGDYLLASTGSAGSPGTGDFCAEAWIYPQNSSTMAIMSNLVSSGGSDTQWGVYMNTGSNYIQFQGWFTVYVTGAAPSLNTWSHVAVCRSGTTLSLFLNGTRLATTTTSNNFSSTNDIRIGAEASGTSPFTGNIANARFVKGAAVYDPTQSTITVPTTPLTAVSGTQLLTLQTPNPANNNGFVDSSSNNFAITRNGNTTQGSFSPYGPSWSTYLSASFLITPPNALFAFGTGAFTVEGWFFNTGTTVAAGLIVGSSNYGTGTDFQVYLNGSTNQLIYYGPTGVTVTASSIPTNTWTHFAAVRSGTTVTLYVNGISVGSATDGNSIASTFNLTIGNAQNNNANAQFVGYVSNIRIVKGTAVYTSNFTPSTVPLTAVSGTSLLTCQSNRFIDNSGNALAVTVAAGTPSVQRFQPFLFNTSYTPSTIGGSGYFDGTGDYLQISDGSAFTLGTNNFTIEAWVYPMGAFANYTTIIAQSNNGSASSQAFDILVNSSGAVLVEVYIGSSAYTITSATLLALNAWSHVSLVRSGSTFTLYINGVSTGTPISNAGAINDSAVAITIGAETTPFRYWNGYICDARIVNGTAIVPPAGGPTSPLTSVANTSLLASMTNAGIVDNAMMNDLETVGNAQISTSVKKYGTGSMYFDGTGDWLYIQDSPNLRITNGDKFTIEGWVYLTALNTSQGVIVKRGSSATQEWAVLVNSSNKIQFGGNTVNYIANTSLLINTWYHFAVTCDGTNINIYLNGASDFTPAAVSSIVNSTNPVLVGAQTTSANPFNGYIDDLRVTKGVARYVANFTPPTSQLQDQ